MAISSVSCGTSLGCEIAMLEAGTEETEMQDASNQLEAQRKAKAAADAKEVSELHAKASATATAAYWQGGLQVAGAAASGGGALLQASAESSRQAAQLATDAASKATDPAQAARFSETAMVADRAATDAARGGAALGFTAQSFGAVAAMASGVGQAKSIEHDADATQARHDSENAKALYDEVKQQRDRAMQLYDQKVGIAQSIMQDDSAMSEAIARR